MQVVSCDASPVHEEQRLGDWIIGLCISRVATGLQMRKSIRAGKEGERACACACPNEMAGRSGVTRQGQGCIAGIRAGG